MIVNTALTAGLNMLWGMFHALQIIAHLPVLNFRFPGNVYGFYSFFINISQFDLIKTDWLIKHIFDMHKQEEPYSEQFGRMQYSNQTAILNLSLIFIMVVMTHIGVLSLLLLMVPANFNARLRHVKNKLSNYLFQECMFRLILESSLELALCSLVDLNRFVEIFHGGWSGTKITSEDSGSGRRLSDEGAHLSQEDFTSGYYFSTVFSVWALSAIVISIGTLSLYLLPSA